MPTQRKVEIVSDLTEKMQRMQMAVVADYRGLSVAEIKEVRKKLREVNSELIVAKNTLLLIAARETGHEAMESLLSGPTAVAFVYDDVARAAKLLNDLSKQTPKPLVIRGGMLGQSPIPADGLEAVIRIPPREQVLAQVLGGIASPVAGLVGMLDAPASGLVGILNAVVSDIAYVLQARADQLQPAGDAAPAA